MIQKQTANRGQSLKFILWPRLLCEEGLPFFIYAAEHCHIILSQKDTYLYKFNQTPNQEENVARGLN